MFEYMSFDAMAISFLCCLILREIFMFALPDSIAGPGGWLIDTDREV